MNEYEEWETFVSNHWALPLVETPGALVAAIETKISRAVLYEQRRIIDLLIAENVLEPTDEFDNDVLKLIRGEDK